MNDNYDTKSPDGQQPNSDQALQSIWEHWGPRHIIILMVTLLFCSYLIQILFYSPDRSFYMPVILGSLLGVVLPLYLLHKTNVISMGKDMSLNLPHPTILVACALIPMAAWAPVYLLGSLSQSIFRVDASWIEKFNQFIPNTPAEIVIAFVAVAIVAPLAEEIIFRALLHRLASRHIGPYWATTLSALVFGSIHGQLWVLFALAGIGVYLAFIFETTRSTTACWLAHSMHNAVSLSLIIVSGGVQNEEHTSTTGDWIWVVVSLAALFGLGRFLIKHRTHQN